MIIRMSEWATRAGADKRSLQLWNDGVRELWYEQDGLIQVNLLAKSGSLDRMTFSAWESRETYEQFQRSEALQRLTRSFDTVYNEQGGRPRADEWTVLTGDWPALA
jgi:heme-degrading monooxygenase HmoA